MGKKKKKKTNKVQGTSISNPAVKQAMANLKESSSPANQNALTISLAKGKFLAPCATKIDENGNTNATFFLLNTEDGKALFPIFTDQMEANNFAYKQEDGSDPTFIIRTIKDYAELFDDPNNPVSGLVLNPGKDSLIITKEMVQQFKDGRIPLLNEAPREVGPTRYVEPAVYPTRMANSVYDYCATQPEISRVWLKEKFSGGDNAISFFVEADGKDRKLLAGISQAALAAQPELNVEVDFITDKIMKEVIEDAVALYDRVLEL